MGDEELQQLKRNPAVRMERIDVPHMNISVWCDTAHGRIRPYVPGSMRREIFDALHSLSHPSIRGTKRLVSQHYIWPLMNRNVADWTRTCCACQRSKVQRHTKAPPTIFEIPDRRFDHVHLDIVGPLPPSRGNSYLLTMVDRFTRWPEAVPIPNASAPVIARAFVSTWVARFGLPAAVTTDQGRQFQSSLWRELASTFGIKLARTTAYHPQANGLVERLHRQLKCALTAHAQSSRSWVDALPLVLLGIRCSVKEDLQHAPAELVYGSPLRLPGVYFGDTGTRNVNEHSDELRAFFSSIRPVPTRGAPASKWFVPKNLETCTHVFLRRDANRPPLSPAYEGPYKMPTMTRAVAARQARLWDHFKMEVSSPASPGNVCNMLADLCRAYNDCMLRRLTDIADRIMETLYHWQKKHPEIAIKLTWLPSGEVISSCGDVNVEPLLDISDDCWDSICFMHSLLDAGCLKRAAMLERRACGHILNFLHFFARYLSIEGCRWTTMNSAEKRKCFAKGAQKLARLRDDIERYEYCEGSDPYICFLYGKVLARLGMAKDAAEAFRRAVTDMPYCWPAWQELANILDDSIDVVQLPDCWMKLLFSIDYYMNRQLPAGAIKALTRFKGTGAMRTPVFIFQAARICASVRDLPRAVKLYHKMMKVDPNCLWSMDFFANILCVRGMKHELASLALRCYQASPESPIALVVWGIVLSSFRSHDKAIECCQRALEKNPLYAEAWVLLGNELTAVRNLNGAEFAYCRGLAVDPSDTRLYYGLGEVYNDVLKPEFAAYWFSMAVKTKRNSTMSVIRLLDQYELLRARYFGKRLIRKLNIPFNEEYLMNLRNRYRRAEIL
uniref:Integrase catalytic domain-containing protein n=1 Tax=Trichuris muris TaxID=70415 RepID=A0A5S6QNU6_TRIMR